MVEPCRDNLGANTDLIRLVAATADLCRKPLRHGVLPLSESPEGHLSNFEVILRLEARNATGERLEAEDLEMDIYRSGHELNITLHWKLDDQRPTLLHGSHPVWMDASGQRCPPPQEGAPLEALEVGAFY